MYYEANVPGAQAHALVVGVGTYPSGLYYGFSDLESPPVSARMFADWLIKYLSHPTAKLASVDLLISPEQVNARADDGRKLPRATFESFQVAADAWFERGNTSADNVMIFYFCGHGVETNGKLSLLFEDFGSRRANPFIHAFDFDKNQLGLAKCRARDQYYFVDACRNQPQNLDIFGDYPSVVLFAPEFGQTHQGDAPVFLATGPDRRAYAYAGQPARFTDAIIRALDGLAAAGDVSVDGNVGWVVNSNSLAQAVGFLLDRENRLPGMPRQEPDKGRGGKLLGKVMHRYDLERTSPTVLVSLEGQPVELLVSLNAPPERNIPPYYSPDPPVWPWQSSVRLLDRHDVYTVAGRLRGQDVQVKPSQLVLIPPFTPAKVGLIGT